MKNAVILAAGTASRFVPLSEEIPKGLLEVRGEVLIERQIRQLREAGVKDICVVVGYKASMFAYLAEQFGVRLVLNEDYRRYNNLSSIIRVLDLLDETYICCSDHYFVRNVFLEEDTNSYYALQFAAGATKEWCVTEDASGRIRQVSIGGCDAWYLSGHVFFAPDFSQRIKPLLAEAYRREDARRGYWEDVLIRHLEELPVYGRKYGAEDFKEFDSIDELRVFDSSYWDDTRSDIVRRICSELHCQQRELTRFEPVKHAGDGLVFTFEWNGKPYCYDGRKADALRPILPFDRENLRQYLMEIFPGKDVSGAAISRMGGMSNKNYRVDFEGKSYVLRIPGPGSEGMVERSNEEFNAREGCRLGVNPPVRYFNVRTGVKLADYVRNAETLDAASIQRPDHLRKIAQIYSRIHGSQVPLKNAFDVFQEIEKYDGLIREAGAVMYAGWDGFKPLVMALKTRLADWGAELCPCHNDAVPENFIKAEDGTLYLIDWEYSGMNDPVADFAALFLESDFSEESRELFLETCYPGGVPAHVRDRILCYEILWDVLWAQWTVVKEACGEDFGSYGTDRFSRAKMNYEQLKFQLI